jgi:hypothetical protein
MNRGKLLKEIEEVLADSTMEESLEVLANMFIRLGLGGMNLEDTPTTHNIAELAIKDVQKSGDTLYNSILRQGLIILAWLDKEVVSE